MNLFLVNHRYLPWAGAIFAGCLTLAACGSSQNASSNLPPKTLAKNSANPQAKYSWIRDNIFNVKCMDCHSTHQGDGDGLASADFDTYQDTLKVIQAGNPEHSDLYVAVETKKMPKDGTPLSATQVQAISDWILSGAPNN